MGAVLSARELARRLAGLGWSCSVEEVHPGFLYGTAHP
jgi:hypothetical protein